MSESVNLPALGESVTEGTVTRWLKQVGDRVEVDEPLLEVSTDKVDTEIPSPIAGVIEEILVAEDETAEVGAPLVRIGDGSGGRPAPASAAAPRRRAPAEPAAEAAPAEARHPPRHRPPRPRPLKPPAAAPAAATGHDVTLPAMGESVTEGTVTRWLKAVGDTVAVDEPLLEVSTDKVDTEIPSPVAGTLLEIRVNEDETAEVGAVLAVIGSGAAAPAAAAAPPRSPSRRARSRAELRAGARARAGPAAAQAPKAARGAPRTGRPAAPAAPAAAPRSSGRTGGSGYVTPAGPQAGQPAGRRPRRAERHRRRRPDPQAGRARRRRGQGSAGRRRAAPAAAAAPAPQPPPARRPQRPRCAAPRRRLPRIRQVIAQQHARVAGHRRPADHRDGGRHDPGRRAAGQGQDRVPGPKGVQAVVPAVLRQGRRWRRCKQHPMINSTYTRT